ncbi:helix-turn-helix domain-containing protein [Stackebrandtia nassauensis]|uniref:Helix-turn-helix domain protein n=1 Tax=Stackebrandtia nassauensis (strain DSM 44728 / CIP 108903 / NRRL B-16338 / NBRC 102104 / LLR-40K-21) TaxID=446470 RepID=D3PY38_STANL|nr:helix-turn-helix transcriptional regulator [Stackebrandtia nassauensis]ADD45367.1 helix-turn-helix domain protein [Stackebrandtia nassauensis DSM 44728]
MLLGAHLRRLREAEGISRSDAGWEIRASDSKISRLELGRVSFKIRDVEDLLTFYGVDDEEERAELLKLAEEANTPGWWHRFGDVLPGWFQSYLGLEATASLIRTYENQFIPGLLQTKAYARGVVLLGHGRASAREVDHRVDLRTSRQQILHRENPPRVWTVVDEAALRRPIGGKQVMREQLEHLIEVSKAPHIQIQIIKFEAGGHAAAGGPFTMLRFPDQELPDIIYIEQLTSALYLDKRDDVDLYTASMERLCVQAEEPKKTPEILREIIGQLYS